MAVAMVHPRGTWVWVFDGSEPVRRNRFSHDQAKFRSGKTYDCDLSASYNIGARYFASTDRLLSQLKTEPTPVGGKTGWLALGKRAGAKPSTTAGPRMPVTLSSLWTPRPERKAA